MKLRSTATNGRSGRRAGALFCHTPERQAGRQSDDYGGWCLELKPAWRYRKEDESG